jgi:hypothetical protein
MRVYVNDQPIDLLLGMTVRHALLRAGLLSELGSGERPFDEWGNELGLDGALAEGAKIYVRMRREKRQVENH